MASSSSEGKQKQTINLSTLSPQQLMMLKEQMEGELQQFAQSNVALQKAAGDFHASGLAIEELATREPGQMLLLPLTSSVYVSGTLEKTDQVLIDVGTGYYVQKSTSGGVDYCKRKVSMLQENLTAISQLIREKQAGLRQINTVLQMKVQTAGNRD